jgi:tRNA (cmo5U34)-methyltransferase
MGAARARGAAAHDGGDRVDDSRSRARAGGDIMTSGPTDHTLPDGRWTFDADVADVFDDMLRRSIPQYDVMRSTVADIGARFVQPQTAIVDLGCSRGDALDPFVRQFGAANQFVGVEVSAPMLAIARARFAGYIRTGVVEIRDIDLRHAYPPARASLTLAVLTLQFVPIEYRPALLRRVFEHTTSGGAFVVVEKVLGAAGVLDELMTTQYLDLKRAHGYSDDEIARKRLSLEGVLVPVTAAWNEDLLRAAGFVPVECFWRWMNFAGWIGLKP